MSSEKQMKTPEEFKPRPSPPLFRAALGAMVGGAALSGLLLLGRDGFARFASCYLLGYAFLWTIALGCLLLVSLHHLTHAVWSVVVRRGAEALAEPIWLVAILFLPILAFGLDFERFRLYPWTSRALVEADPLLIGKGAYLNLPFFAIRAGLFFAIWIGFARFFIGESLKQDKGESGAAGSLRLRRLSAPFVVLFGFTASFAGVDWLMSLDPHWSSTIFGVYVFAGMALAAMSAIALIALWLERGGRLGTRGLNDDHIYTLSVLVFSFACFWAYIAFSQYLLIWYANLPEEASYIARRIEGGWLPVSVALALIRFVIPFLALLSQKAKMNRRVLAGVAALMLGGQLLDLFWIVMPELDAKGPKWNWLEAGPALFLVGLFLMRVNRFLEKNAAIPYGDPLFSQSGDYRL